MLRPAPLLISQLFNLVRQLLHFASQLHLTTCIRGHSLLRGGRGVVGERIGTVVRIGIIRQSESKIGTKIGTKEKPIIEARESNTSRDKEVMMTKMVEEERVGDERVGGEEYVPR